MTKTEQPRLGSISHGTLRTYDLTSALAGTLDDYGVSLESVDGLTDALELDEDDEFWNSEEASWLLERIEDSLMDLAAPFTYFGAHPGDGSDYGFWPDFDAVDMARTDGELPDTATVPEDYNGLSVDVNDHGNMAILSHDGAGNRTIVWDCV